MVNEFPFGTSQSTFAEFPFVPGKGFISLQG